MDRVKKYKFSWLRLGRVVAKTILYIILFILILVLSVHLPPVQRLIRVKVLSYLERTLETKVEVGKIKISLPENIQLEDVYVEDRQKDTLLAGGVLKANINLWRLAFNNEVNVESVSLENITAKFNRKNSTEGFNFQFVIDAFPGKPKTRDSVDSSSAISLKKITLNRIRLVYNDSISGNDLAAWINHLDARIDLFDPQRLQFDVPEATIDGLDAHIYQRKPLASDEPQTKDIKEALQPIPLQIQFKKTSLNNIGLDYRNDVSATYADFNLGKLVVEAEYIDLPHRIINLEGLLLDRSSINLRLGQKEAARIVAKETEQEIRSQAIAGWEVSIASLEMKNNNFKFDNDNSPRINNAIDYSHLKIDSLVLEAEKVIYRPDSISSIISNAAFREKNGFILNKLKADFSYSNTGISLSDLYLKTPGTELKRDIAIRYDSLGSLQHDIGNMELDLELEDSRLLVNDALQFAPSLKTVPAFAYPQAVWWIDSRISGRLADLQIDHLQIRGLQSTSIDINGNIGGLPDMNNLSANLMINNIRSSRNDLMLFLPKNSLPSNITIPSWFNISGGLKGHKERMNSDLRLNTSLGNARIKGEFKDLGDKLQARYNTNIRTEGLDMATLFQNKELPRVVSGAFRINGRGYTRMAELEANGIIQSVRMLGYTYRNLELSGSLDNQLGRMKASITDPNIDFDLTARADLSGKYPSLQVKGMVDSIKFHNLNLSSDILIYRGGIDANFPGTHPDYLEGNLYLTQSLFVYTDQRLQLDTIQVSAGKTNGIRYLRLFSDVMNANMEGVFRITELASIFQQAVQPYFAVKPGVPTINREAYDFTLNVYITDNPALRIFSPDLKHLDSVFLQSHFSSSSGWSAVIEAPELEWGATRVHDLKLQAGTGLDAILVNVSMQQLLNGKTIRLDNTSISARLAHNTIDFTFNSKDPVGKDKYNISGILQQPRNGNYELAIHPDSLLLNYEQWSISGSNKMLINRQGINASNFILSKNGEQLAINSISNAIGAPLEMNFTNFKLATITGFVQSDTSFANGLMNGKVNLIKLSAEPVFTSDLRIDDFIFKKDSVGNINLLVNSREAGSYSVNVSLTGRDNDVKLTGNYYAAATNRIDLDLDMRRLNLASAQPFLNNMISAGTGSLNGKFDITGSFAKPVVRGDLNFNKAGFTFNMFNSHFTIDQEKIRVNEEGLWFDRFAIRDSAQNPLIISGSAATRNFVNYEFDMVVSAVNFRALNSTKRDNSLYYGQLYFDTDLRIRGNESTPVVDGSLIVNEQTRMTVVLPQREPGIIERDGVVEFVDFDAPLNDSLFLAPYDSLNRTGFRGMDMIVNVEVDRQAEFNLIIDEGNGDFLNVKGEALLTAGVDPSGKVTLSGSYELDEGSYELTFNFVKRKFVIQKGSRIVWEGEPSKATLDVEAIYVANAAPLDLVKNQLGEATAFERNTYLQKLPFDVHLDMEGELLQPTIRFDIVLPEKNYVVSGEIIANVRTRLEQLRNEPGEMNKQVFSLLLLNRFMSENPFKSSEGGPNPGAFVRQSVSKLLTEQLNELSREIIAGVDLSFDIVSSEDYTTGERRDRTDLDVKLSKRLLNDRLTVTVGSDFELEGPQRSHQQSSNIAGNVALDYRISKDNRYMLRAYRKNEYQGIIEGYIIETGVGFIITVDYNRLRQIFMSSKERKSRRQIRREQNRLNEQRQAELQTGSVAKPGE